MPDRDSEAGQSSNLHRGLIWAGVVLAPVAAGVMLLGATASTMRFAVLLLAVSVLLVGVSVLVRSDPALQKMDFEERLADEVRALRVELKAELRAEMRRPAGPPPAEKPVMPQPGMAPQGMGGSNMSGPIPRQRGAASVPPPAPAPGRASAAVRTGNQYGNPPDIAEDFGAANGYEDVTGPYESAPYEAPRSAPGQTYGSASASVSGPRGPQPAAGPRGPQPVAGPRGPQPVTGPRGPQPVSGPHGPQPVSGARPGAGVYGAPQQSYAPDDEYDEYDEYEDYSQREQPPAGDPNYRARRHRPSANDTNVGTLADFARMSGYDEEPDERYVTGYGEQNRW